jgi:hypothetical protein
LRMGNLPLVKRKQTSIIESCCFCARSQFHDFSIPPRNRSSSILPFRAEAEISER